MIFILFIDIKISWMKDLRTTKDSFLAVKDSDSFFFPIFFSIRKKYLGSYD